MIGRFTRRAKRRAKQRAKRRAKQCAKQCVTPCARHRPRPWGQPRATASAPPAGGRAASRGPVTLRCAHCRRQFTCTPSAAARGRRYHSQRCARAAQCRRVRVDCLRCGAPFLRSRLHVSQQTGRGMCCKRCQRKWARERALRGWPTGFYVTPIALRKRDREVW